MKLIVKIVIVLAINVALFSILPVTNSVMEALKDNGDTKGKQEMIIASITKPKPKNNEKARRRNIRNVKSSSGRSVNSSFKFDIGGAMGTVGGDGAVIASSEMRGSDLSNEDVDQDALVINRVAPEFPIEAKKLGIGGEVYIKFVVDIDGKVSRFENIHAPHPSFANSIERAFSQWKFKPAMKNGAPVQQKMELTINFNLEE